MIHYNLQARRTIKADKAEHDGKRVKTVKTKEKAWLTDEQIELLTKLGFDWKPERTLGKKSWMDRYEDLKIYKGEHGDTWVRRRDKNHRSLGEWCYRNEGLRACQVI